MFTEEMLTPVRNFQHQEIEQWLYHRESFVSGIPTVTNAKRSHATKAPAIAWIAVGQWAK